MCVGSTGRGDQATACNSASGDTCSFTLTVNKLACVHRYADKLEAAHDAEHLAKFEELLEAAVDLDRIPDEYLICASYDADLQVPSNSLAVLRD